MHIFWRKGYTATSIEDLVETLHLSRSSLYDTFGDKRTLFLEALKLYSERVFNRLEKTLKEASSPLAGLQTIFDELIASAGSESGAMGCFMVNSVAELVPYDADVTKLATAYADTFQHLLVEALTKAELEDKVMRNQTPQQLAVYVFNVIQGLRILIKSGTTREQVQAICAIAMQSLQ